MTISEIRILLLKNYRRYCENGLTPREIADLEGLTCEEVMNNLPDHDSFWGYSKEYLAQRDKISAEMIEDDLNFR